MAVCLSVAALTSFFSIFAFFGHVMGNDYGVGPNMFDVMFGTEGNIGGYGVKWKLYGGMTFLFALQVVIMLVAIGAAFVLYRMVKIGNNEKQATKVAGIMIFLSLVVCIVSFCSLPICDNADSGATLGLGPILYSCLHIAVIVFLIIGLLVQHNQLTSEESSYIQPTNTSTQQFVEKPVYQKPQEVKPASNNSLSENEKADLILKYKKMLDDGAITQEEYDIKKKQLLK